MDADVPRQLVRPREAAVAIVDRTLMRALLHRRARVSLERRVRVRYISTASDAEHGGRVAVLEGRRRNRKGGATLARLRHAVELGQRQRGGRRGDGGGEHGRGLEGGPFVEGRFGLESLKIEKFWERVYKSRTVLDEDILQV